MRCHIFLQWYVSYRTFIYKLNVIQLSVMPWLEILDLSRNYISSFPENPGSLLSLRVLHIGRNRITSLPQYFPDFRDLSLFKVADNPITWPPNQIINGPEDSTKQREVQEWIENIKRWMLEHSDVSGPLSDPLTQESYSPPPEVDLTSDDEKVSVRSYTSSRAHFRNPSIDSVGSHYSTTSGPQSGASSPRRPQGLRTLIRFEKHRAVYFKSRPEPPRCPRWMANETGTLNDFPRSLHRPSPRLCPHHCWIQSTPALASCSLSLKTIPHSPTTPFMQS